MSRTKSLLVAVAFFIAMPVAVAIADEPTRLPPGESTALAVPDSSLEAVKNRIVIVTQENGAEIIGTVASYDRNSMTLIEEGSGQVRALSRHMITGLRLASVAPSASATATAIPQNLTLQDEPARKRHIGLQIFDGPGNLMLDAEFGHFYGFVGTSIGYPLLFSGSNTSGQYFGASVGAGGTWKFSPKSNWNFDLFGMLIPTWWGDFNMGIGVGVGVHYTSPTGFTVGFKLPVFGVATGVRGYDSGTGSPTAAALLAVYYAEAAMQLPIISLGYRF